MSHCFIVAGMDGRIGALERCVDCIKASKYADSDVYLYYQGTELYKLQDRDFFKYTIVDAQPRGVFTPRYELMKRFSLDYDFTIIIDDDLFMYPDTSYENAMAFLNQVPTAGCVCIGTHFNKRENKMVCVSDNMGYYNIRGGLVLPQNSVKIILDYFNDKEADYSEDTVWLLLYVKGLDLWQDHSSNAIHTSNYKEKKKHTGYSMVRLTKPYIPILSEYFNDTELTTENGRWDIPVRNIKSLCHINDKGLAERNRNRG